MLYRGALSEYSWYLLADDTHHLGWAACSAEIQGHLVVRGHLLEARERSGQTAKEFEFTNGVGEGLVVRCACWHRHGHRRVGELRHSAASAEKKSE